MEKGWRKSGLARLGRPRLQPAPLADPEGSPEEAIFTSQTPKCGTSYVDMMTLGHSPVDF